MTKANPKERTPLAAAKWLFGIVLGALGLYATGVINAILGSALPAPIEVCRKLGVCAPAEKEIFCADKEIGRQGTPARFDFGFPDRCPRLLHIDNDQYCDYCRVVGNDAELLWCTFGTDSGLTGVTLRANINDSGYPNECKWVDFEGKGVPAFWRVIGNSHERVAITPVTPDGIGRTVVQPKTE